MLGLCLAAQHYDKSLGYTFSSYARKYIYGYIQHLYREEIGGSLSVSRKDKEEMIKNKNYVFVDSIDREIHNEDNDSLFLKDSIGDIDLSVEEQAIQNIDLHKIISKQKNPKIIENILHGYNQVEAGKINNTSKQWSSIVWNNFKSDYQKYINTNQ